MKFTIIERNGTKKIDDWFVENLKQYAKEKHGVNLNVELVKRSDLEKTS